MTDHELRRVFDHLEALDPMSIRFERVFRSTYDQLYDGQRTGRFSWESLYKTEKTHFGTLVEINAQREFAFPNGSRLDFSIEGVEVDCKFSQSMGAWMLPPQVVGHLCLVITSSDKRSTFSVGLVRADEALLRTSENQDRKRALNPMGRESVQWLHFPAPPHRELAAPSHRCGALRDRHTGERAAAHRRTVPAGPAEGGKPDGRGDSR